MSRSQVPLTSQIGSSPLKGAALGIYVHSRCSWPEVCPAGRDRQTHSEHARRSLPLGLTSGLCFPLCRPGLAFGGNGTVYRGEGLGWLLQLSGIWGCYQ